MTEIQKLQQDVISVDENEQLITKDLILGETIQQHQDNTSTSTNELKQSSQLNRNPNKGKTMFTQVKEKKQHLEKVQSLTNRIKRLSEQENKIQRQAKIQKKETEKIEITKFLKARQKSMVENKKIVDKINLESKKAQIEQEKRNRRESIDQAIENVYLKNKTTYDLAKGDRLVLNSMMNQFNSHQNNVNNFKILKIKQDINSCKTERIKKQTSTVDKATQEFDLRLSKEICEKDYLAVKIEELSKLEETKLENLRRTMLHKDAELGEVREKIRNRLNNSMLDLHGSNTDRKYSINRTLLEDPELASIDKDLKQLKNDKSENFTSSEKKKITNKYKHVQPRYLQSAKQPTTENSKIQNTDNKSDKKKNINKQGSLVNVNRSKSTKNGDKILKNDS
jgi:hypothetical protein